MVGSRTAGRNGLPASHCFLPLLRDDPANQNTSSQSLLENQHHNPEGLSSPRPQERALEGALSSS